jgi:hypothetical protein
VANEWEGFSLTIDPNEFLGGFLDQIDAVLSYGISLLELADLILSVMQSLISGLLDPIRAIVEALLDELRAIISDIKNTGLYVTGDFKLLTPDNLFANVVGGYQAYEQRMISRFVDRADLNRPDFSYNSKVFGIFFYVSSGDIGKIIKAISSLAALFGPFGQGNTSFPPPSTPKAEISQNQELVLSWSFSQVAGVVNGLLAPAPAGFVVEISTIPSGLQVVARPSDDVNSQSLDPTKSTIVCSDPKSGNPLLLFGGVGVGGAGAGGSGWSSLESGPQQIRLRIDQNNPLIKPSDLFSGQTVLLGNAFYVKAGVFPKLVPGQTFTTSIPRSMLPLHASFGPDGSPTIQDETRTYYVRIRAIASDLAEAIENAMGYSINVGADAQQSGVGDPTPMSDYATRLFFFSSDGVRSSGSSQKFSPDADVGVLGSGLRNNLFSSPSSPVAATFPSAAVLNYRNTVQAAITVAILARMDLKPSASYAQNRVSSPYATGLEGFISTLLVKNQWFNTATPATQSKFRNVVDFRKEVQSVAENISYQLLQDNPPSEEMARLVVDQGSALFDFKYNGLNVVELTESESTSEGLGPNSSKTGSLTLGKWVGPKRLPGFLIKDGENEGIVDYTWVQGVGSADNSPVLYGPDLDRNVEFFRNVAIENDLITPTANVLRFAAGIYSRPPNDSQWVAIRIFPQNLTPIVGILDLVEDFLSGVFDGVQGVVDSIVAAIEAIRARINQLQALLEAIRAFIRSLSAFSISPMQALAVTADGTDDLLNKFMTASNKPSDGTDAYGAGAVVVMGVASVNSGILRILGGG